MAYSVNRTQGFESDLDDALAYLAGELKSPQAALSLIDEMENAIAFLGSQPYSHAVSRKPRFAERSYREHFVKGYVIVYRIIGEEVLFLRFFHQGQMYERFVMEWNQ